MLGQPVYFLTPDVVGFEFTGRLREGVTATDLVLDRDRDPAPREGRRQVRRVLRRRHREPGGARPRDDRQHGARVRRDDGLLPGRRQDDRVLPGHRPHGRARSRPSRPTSRRRACSACRAPARSTTRRSSRSTSARSRRASPGPKRPQDRIEIGNVKDAVHVAVQQAAGRERLQPAGRAPADAPPRARRRRPCGRRRRCRHQRAAHAGGPAGRAAPRRGDGRQQADARCRACTRPSLRSRRSATCTIGNGDVLIAAITSCTNTSNPSVMLARRPAREEGGRGRAHGQAAHQDLARARLAHRHRVPEEGRPAALPREARLQRSPPTAARPASATPAT